MLNRVSNSSQFLQSVSSQADTIRKKVEGKQEVTHKDLEKFINTLETSSEKLQRSIVQKEPADAKVIRHILESLKFIQTKASFQVQIGSLIVTLRTRWDRSVKNFEQILKKLKRGEKAEKVELGSSSHQGQ